MLTFRMDAILKAISEPHRRQILALLRNREVAAGSIAERFRITRSAVSQHIAVLKHAGLVAERREGARRLYRAEPQAFAGLRLFVDDYWDARLSRSSRQAEGGGAGFGGERVSVEREVRIAAGRERVWQFLVDPERAARWMGVAAHFDLRPGGRYEVEVLPGLVAAGTFIEIDAPRRLVHTWGWELGVEGPVPPGSTMVVIDLLAESGGTRMRLSHRDLPSIATAGSHSRGWAHYLPRLAEIAAGGKPAPDPWVADPARMRNELRPASGGSPEA